jgi:hypothetical protein
MPNFPDDPGLTQVADHARFGFQAAMEIGCTTQRRTAAR